MASSTLHSIFDIQPTSKLASPQPTYQKSKGNTPQNMHEIGILPDVELEQYPAARNDSPDDKTNGTRSPDRNTSIGAQTPRTPKELEMSRPATPTAEDAVGMIRTWNADPMTKWRILCCCVIYFSNGMNDSGMRLCICLPWLVEFLEPDTNQSLVVGALIPYMETWYKISYSIMSLVFVGNAIGFITAAFFTNTILSKLGRAKTLIVAEIIQLSAYIIMVCTPPYPLVVVS